MLAADRHPDIVTHVLPDERCAGFFALGLARGQGAPVALVCTSGSAPANWLPAVVEASQLCVPLFLLSADRPPSLRGKGANQTVWQPGMFGVHARESIDLPVPNAQFSGLDTLLNLALDAALGEQPGPVQINVPLAEPLVPKDLPPHRPITKPPAPTRMRKAGDGLDDLAEDLRGRSGLIVAGPLPSQAGLARALSDLARRLDWPILADPLSNLRCGGHDRKGICGLYDNWLRTLDLSVERVLHFGGAPVSKVLLGWLAKHARVQVRPFGEFYDPDGHLNRAIVADETEFCRSLNDRLPVPVALQSTRRILRAESIAAERIDRADNLPLQGLLVRAIERHVPADGLLFLGNSLAVREVDWFMKGRTAPLAVFGNRGASGIDGNVSSALGLARGRAGRAVALLGDLSLYHDMNGLLAARQSDILFVVINNGGGGIFRHLPQATLQSFERYWLTPTGLSMARIAELYGLHFQRLDAEGVDEGIAQALTRAGPQLIELTIDPDTDLSVHAEWFGT